MTSVVIDYYEELNLDKTHTLDEINEELNHLESVWKRREITNPEKATKVLSIIIDARKVFKDQESKRQYDHELYDYKNRNTDDIEKNEDSEKKFKEWVNKASELYLSSQNDLALDAINTASRYKESEDSSIYYYFRAEILRANGNIIEAKDAAIHACVLDPSDINLSLKGDIYISLAEKAYSQGNSELSKEYLEQCRNDLNKCVEICKTKGNDQFLIDTLELLATSYLEPADCDIEKAEMIARRASALNGDTSRINNILDAINEEKRDFTPYQGKNHPSSSTGPACYVATAVYGSYDCPEVWTLRRYRDYKLQKTARGRIFVKAYYSISPILVKYFGETKFFKSTMKIILDNLVHKLKERGFEDSKYDDN